MYFYYKFFNYSKKINLNDDNEYIANLEIESIKISNIEILKAATNKTKLQQYECKPGCKTIISIFLRSL